MNEKPQGKALIAKEKGKTIWCGMGEGQKIPRCQ